MAGQTVNDEPVVEELDEVWASVLEACQELPDDEWDRPTDCPRPMTRALTTRHASNGARSYNPTLRQSIYVVTLSRGK